MHRTNFSIFALIFFVACLAVVSHAQPAVFSNEVEVKVLRGVTVADFRCNRAAEIVYTKENIQKFLNDKECTEPAKLNVDFEKESVVGFSTGGDCHVRATAKIFRNDKAKTYTVAVITINGGCRAAGDYFGWLVIEKIPSEYTVSYTHSGAEKYDKGLAEQEIAFFRSLNSPRFQKLETRDIDLKGCIRLFGQHKRAIFSSEDFLNTVGNDGGERCVKKVEKIDFTKHSLLGININSGYCGIPLDLKYEAFRDDNKQQYLLSISYTEPSGTCRAISSYDLWVLVPKMPDGYEVKFEEKALSGTNSP